MGTASNEWYSSSPVSGRYENEGCFGASGSLIVMFNSAARPTRPSPRFMRVKWTAVDFRPSVANSSSEPS